MSISMFNYFAKWNEENWINCMCCYGPRESHSLAMRIEPSSNGLKNCYFIHNCSFKHLSTILVDGKSILNHKTQEKFWRWRSKHKMTIIYNRINLTTMHDDVWRWIAYATKKRVALCAQNNIIKWVEHNVVIMREWLKLICMDYSVWSHHN